MTSLAELRQIEQQRMSEEQEAVIREAELLRQAREAAEAAARQQAEAAIREQHERALALERARFEAEREARLRVEAAERAERERQQQALERERELQELEVRRMEVEKKRPRWMVAVTILAVAAACVLAVFTVQALAASEQANDARTAAEHLNEQKAEEARQMRAALDRLESNLHELDGQLVAALDRVDKLQDQAELERAAAEIKRLREQRVRDAHRKAELLRLRLLQQRLHGVHQVCASAVCKDTK